MVHTLRISQNAVLISYEQHTLKEDPVTLSAFIEAKEQKTENITQFISIIRKYEYITELMHELIDHIEIHAPNKSSGCRQQKVDIYFRFKAAAASAVISRKDYKNGKQAT